MEQAFVTYDKTKNPGEAALPGVPLADMTEADFVALPEWLRNSVMVCAFYTVAKTDGVGDGLAEVDVTEEQEDNG